MEMPLWYTGVCDSMAAKVLSWYRNWHLAPVYATREKMQTDGTIVQVPTMRAVPVAWTRAELEHLVRILKALRPDWAITSDLAGLLQNFDTAKLLPNKQRLISMRSYIEDPKEILDVLVEAKKGKPSFEQEAAEALKRGESILG